MSIASLANGQHLVATKVPARHSRKQSNNPYFTTEAQRSHGSTSSPRAEFYITAHPELSRRTRLRGEISFGPIQSTPPLDNLRKPRKLSEIRRPLGFGFASRRDAKRQAQGMSSRANARDLGKISLFVRNDNVFPLRLCVPSTLLRTCFAGDIPSIGCGSAALGASWS